MKVVPTSMHFPFLIVERLSFLEPVVRALLRWSPAGKGMQFLASGAMKLLESRRSKTETVSLSVIQLPPSMFIRTASFLSLSQPTDLLQLLVDANRSSDSALEDGAIVAHSVGFLLAGYETTSNAVTYMSYLLALNPDVQERLANEIHTYLQEHPVGELLL